MERELQMELPSNGGNRALNESASGICGAESVCAVFTCHGIWKSRTNLRFSFEKMAAA